MPQDNYADELISLDLTAIFTDPKLKRRVKRFEKPIKRLTRLSMLEAYHNKVHQDKTEYSTWQKWLNHLRICHAPSLNNQGSIPEKGAVLFLSNHPFGMVDGITLIALIKSVRPDVKIMTNLSLQPISGMREDIIGVDPYEQISSKKANMVSIRSALNWLKSEGALVVFPSGDVSIYDKVKRCAIDPDWNPLIGRLALKAKADIVPVFIHGQNSKIFYQLRRINQRLGSFMLARECLKKRNSIIYYSIGKKIPNNTLQTMQDARAVINYARKKAYELAGISE